MLLTEARERVGGNITTRSGDGYQWEEGPNSFQPSDAMLKAAVRGSPALSPLSLRQARFLGAGADHVRLQPQRALWHTPTLSIGGALALCDKPARWNLSCADCGDVICAHQLMLGLFRLTPGWRTSWCWATPRRRASCCGTGSCCRRRPGRTSSPSACSACGARSGPASAPSALSSPCRVRPCVVSLCLV